MLGWVFVDNREMQHMTASRFSSLAGFLGVKAFPDIEFPRYNSIGGHRTDLCRNMTLVPLDERLWGSVT